MDLAVVLLTAFALQFGSHFVPYARILGKKELPRLAAYTIGTFTNLIVLTIHLLNCANWSPEFVIASVWGVSLFGGAGVSLGYLVDEWNRRGESEKAAAQEAENERQITRVVLEMRDAEIERLR